MDQPIRPRQSNHHKPRIRENDMLGLGFFRTFAVRLPRYLVRQQPDGSIVLQPNGYVLAAQTYSLEVAMRTAAEAVEKHMPWVLR